MDGILIIGLLLLGGFAIAAANKKNVAGLEDSPVSAENIRKGVQRGWYNAVLVRVNNMPCVRLSGRTANGKDYTDVFPITQEDFDALQREGYLIVGS